MPRVPAAPIAIRESRRIPSPSTDFEARCRPMTDSCAPAGDCCVPETPKMPQPDRALIIHSREFPAKKVEMEGAEGVTIREMITCRDGAPNFAMRLFEVAPGGHTPLHTHPYEHEVFILDGEGVLGGGIEARPLRPGDAVFVPASILHQFRNTGQRPLRFLCLIPNLPG